MGYRARLFCVLMTVLCLYDVKPSYAQFTIKRSAPTERRVEPAVKPGMRVRGMVTDDQGKGVSGVVMTDGTEFTTTDEHGFYYLPADPVRSRMVWMSVPSAYEVGNVYGLADGFYARLDSTASQRHDFQLRRRADSSDRFVYLAVSDPQLQNEHDLGRFRNETVPDMAATLGGYPGHDAYAVMLGDEVFDRMDLFDAYIGAITSVGARCYHVMGNHDYNQQYPGMDNCTDTVHVYAEQDFESHFGPSYYSFNVGQVHVVTLKDIDYRGAKRYDERFTPQQLAWLRKDLSYVAPGSLVFINVHAPTSNQTEHSNTDNTAELMEILRGYRVHIFAGHTHFYENRVVNDSIYEHNIGAACGAWWQGHVNRCGAPNGYLVVEVDGDQVSWRYKATGRPDDYLFRVYRPGTFLSQPDYLVVNVWDWDPAWKVCWYEDGQLRGPMEQFAAEDQDYISMVGQAHGYETRHLFRAKPSAGVHSVRIEATDRFGRTFSQTVKF